MIIKVDGEIVGAIGVSGAPTVQNDVDWLASYLNYEVHSDKRIVRPSGSYSCEGWL
jgi:Haem-degrading